MRKSVLAVFIALQIGDFLTTLWVTHHKGGYEANVLMAHLFAVTGLAMGLFLVKAGACWIGSRLHGFRLYAATGVYGFVVAWNLFVMALQAIQVNA